jgi:hypothetical protein
MLLKKDMWLGIFSILLGCVVIAATQSMPAAAAYFPRFISVLTIIIGAVIAGKDFLTKSESEKKGEKKSYRRVIAIVALMVAYYFALWFIGYTISTFLLITAGAMILGYNKWIVTLITAFTVSISLYLIFTNVFNIRFPGVFF